MKFVTALLAILVVALSVALVLQVRARRSLEAALMPAHQDLSPAQPAGSVPRHDADWVPVLESLRRENQRLRQQSEAQIPAGDHSSADKIAILKEILARLPEQAIPELELATDGDWYSAVDGPLESTAEYRASLAKLRGAAQTRFAAIAAPALRKYLDANNQTYPRDLLQLRPYLGRAVDPSVLERYRIVPASEVNTPHITGPWVIAQQHVTDSVYDLRLVIGPDGYGSYRVK